VAYQLQSFFFYWPVVTNTQYLYKREQTLSYARSLRSIHLFSPLLSGGQFHAYLTAQAQSAVPKIFAFLTYQTYQNSNALFNLLYYLTIRLWARDFYEVIVDETEGRINYRPIETESE